MTSAARTFALGAGALLAAAVMWMLVLGPAASEAAGGRHHHGKHHRTRVHVPKNFLGLLPGAVPFDEKDAAKVSDTGVRTVRIGMPWVTVQRHRGPFTWTGTDVMVARLAKNGISPLPTLAGTPSWVASKSIVAPVINSAATRAWQTYVMAAVRRYGPGGTFWNEGSDGRSPFHTRCRCGKPPLPIKAWQIWNEPNLKKYLAPRPSPKIYAKLVKASSAAIRAVDPDAKVVLAGLAEGGDPKKKGATPFLTRFYRSPGIKKSFDAVGIHPYARNLRNLRIAMTSFRKVMKRKHDARTGLWVTEFGWGSGHPNRFGHNKGIRGQARILKKSITMLAKNRKAWHVAHAYWFFWRDPPKSVGNLSCSFCTSSGLLKNNRKPKPAFKAFKRLANSSRR